MKTKKSDKMKDTYLQYDSVDSLLDNFRNNFFILCFISIYRLELYDKDLLISTFVNN